MSKLHEILDNNSLQFPEPWFDFESAEKQIKALMLELVGDMEERETSDMALKSWAMDDYKAFGRNDLRSQILKKIGDL